MKKIIKTLILTAIMTMMFSMTAFAGNTDHNYTLKRCIDYDTQTYETVNLNVHDAGNQWVLTVTGITDFPDAGFEDVISFDSYTYLESDDYDYSSDYDFEPISFGGAYGNPIVNKTVTVNMPKNKDVHITFDNWSGGDQGGCSPVGYLLPDGRFVLYVYDDIDKTAYNGLYTTSVETINGYTDTYYFAIDTKNTTIGNTTTAVNTTVPAIDVSSVFNATDYATFNPDLATAGITSEVALKNHFITSGMKEGRIASKDFNIAVYKAKNPDLVTVFGEDNTAYFMHYINGGKAEGRIAK